MNIKKFSFLLLISNAFSLLSFFVLKIIFEFKGLLDFFGLSLLFFSLFCIILYFLAVLSVSNSFGLKFDFIMLTSIFAKLILCVAFIWMMRPIFGLSQPMDILPFLAAYVCFTIFEVHFMSELAKTEVFK